MKVIGYTTSIILGTTQFVGGTEALAFVANISTMRFFRAARSSSRLVIVLTKV